MRFDADAFTALHEGAHVWFNHGLADERWLIEGFASYYAEVVGRTLEVELLMSELTDEIRQSAFPLVRWADLGEEEPEREDYGYAASHAVAREIAEVAGPDVMRTVWAQAHAEELAYGVHPDWDERRAGPNSSDWQRFLDLFENASDRDFDPLWRDWLLTDEMAAELEARHEARAEYEATEAALGEWLMPDSTRAEMEVWDFEEAMAELAEVNVLVDDHAAFVDRADALELEPSGEVGELLGTDGIGGAVDELDRQDEALVALAAATERLAEERVLLEEIGLLWRPDPADALDDARSAFTDGDEAVAARQAEAAAEQADAAAGDGRMRVALVGGGILLVDALAMAALAMFVLRRRRRRHRYEPPTV
jgi:hypothetical protein